MAALPVAGLPLRSRRWLPSEGSAAGRALRLLIYALPLLVPTALHQPICLYAIVFRSPCPGCGLTRATIALASGDLALALRMNPLSPLVCPAAAAIAAYGVVRYVLLGRSGLDNKWISGTVVALSVALFVVWAARMLFGAFGGPVPV